MNRTLAIFSNPTPYFKGLRPITGSVLAAILMQQLEYWFDRSGDGFYKFLEPCQHAAYREGDSWVEELGFSSEEFRTAFDKIGIRYKSRTQHGKAIATKQLFIKEDGITAMYCSYFDKIKGMTFYFRNHSKVDAQIEMLCANSVSSEPRLLETNNPKPQKPTTPSPRNQQSQAHLYTETNTETNSRDYNTHLEANEAQSDAFEAVPEKEVIPDSSSFEQKELELSTNKTIHEDKPSAPPEYELIDDIEALPIAPHGKRILPWEKQGRGQNDKYDWDFAQWLYENHLKWYSNFTKEGFKKNKIAVRGFLLKAHSDLSRLEKLVDMWNAFVESLTELPEQPDMPLDTFVNRIGGELRQIILERSFTSEQLAQIAELWQAAGGKESMTILLMKDASLI